MRYKSDEYYEKNGKLMPNDIKYTNSLVPRYNWFTFKVLGEAGLGLGIAAVGNAFSQLIQKAKVNFTKEYLSQYNLRLPIGDISTRVLKDGQPKATAYSQLINLLVDVVNDPRVGYANMGDSVIPIVNLMINFGTPIQDIVYFINQPIIVDYVSYISKNRKSVVDGEYQEDGFASYLKDKILDYKKTPLKLPEAVGEYLKLTAQELSEKLSDVEFNASKESMGYKLKEVSDMTEKVSQEQLLILAQFAQMEQIAKDFLQLQVTMNFDTNLVQDGFEAYQKEELFKEIKGKDIFTNLDDLREKTVIAPLNVLKEVVNINAQLLPLANDKVIYNFLSAKLATEFANKGNKAKKKFVRTFKNDFIMYLFQNFMDRNPDAMLRFNTTFAPVLKTKEKDYTNRPIAFGNYLIKNLYKEFADIKNDPKYKDLFKQYLLLDRLFVSSEEEIKNIGLSYFNKDSQLQDTYIEQFKELLNNPDLEIKNFMLKFAYMSFYQSGLNKSFISSTDILPVPILSGMLEDVREQYLKEFDTPIKKLNLLGDFYTLLKANNEFLRSGTIETIIGGEKIKEKAKNKKFNLTKVSSYRGKNFRTNIDNLLIQPVNMPIQQSEEEGLQDEGDKIQLYGNVYANKGQTSAIQNFREFIHSTNKSFLLKGRGGTGKSTIAGKMLLDAQKEGYYIFGTAISDAATSNLRNLTNNYKSLNIGIYNFASMFGLVPKYDNDGNLTSFDFPSKDTLGFNEPKIVDSGKTILVFDEASMVGKEVLEKIKKLLPNSKILYMGDNAQIKPIGQNETISPIFTNSDTTSELTEVMRQGLGSPILEIASNLAKDIDTYDFEDKNTDLPALNKYNFEYFNTKDNSGTLITTDIYKFVEEAVKDFKQYGAKSTIVITGNNDNVEKLNKEIRSKIVSGDDIFVKGERLMTYSKYTKKSKYSDDSIENSSIVYINSARPTEVLGIPAYQLEVSYTNKEGKEMTAYMNVLLKSDKQNANKLFDLKREVFKQLKAKQNVGENRVKADILNQTIVVDYGYAMTAHKVQGQTVRNSYVYPVYRGFDKEESTRMFYTSITRPTDKLVIFDKEGNNQSNLDKFVNQQTTEQPINKEIKSKIDTKSPEYGVVQVETNPTKEKTKQFIDLLRPQIQRQTYKENKGKYANEMFHYGLMWARTNNLANPVKINSFDRGVYYSYHELDQKGNTLPDLSVLQPIIDEIQQSLGLDMSDYDSVIGNIYLDDQYIYPHKDTTESASARNYPVIVYTIGNNAGLGIVDNNDGKMTFANQYDKQWLPSQEKLKGYTNELQTKNGSIYTFGLDGKGRFELTHSTPMNNKKMEDFPPITLPNGKIVTKYTITLTFRRAKDLTNSTPITPKKLIQEQPINKEIKPNENLTPKANIPQNLVSGKEAFGTKQEANAETKKALGANPHSIDMVEAGFRTRTTRSVGEMEKYNVKVGDIVKQFGKSADGTTKNILTRVTAIHPKGTPGFLGTWNKEGWTQDGIKAIERFKDGAAAIEFEVVNQSTEIKPNEVKGENITSKGSEFAKKLTNVGNTVGLTYKGKDYVNSEHAYQTWKSGEFNQAGYNLKGGKVRGGKIGDTFFIMTDILTEKLKQHPDLVQGINERGGLEYLQKSTHNVIGDKFWESTGQNKFIEALTQAYKNSTQPTEIKPKIDSSKKIENLKRGDIINFQQQNFQIERVTEEGFDVRDVNTGEVDFITKEDYESENKKELKPKVVDNNQEITKEDTDKLPPCIG
jgi:hypothetical protein